MLGGALAQRLADHPAEFVERRLLVLLVRRVRDRDPPARTDLTRHVAVTVAHVGGEAAEDADRGAIGVQLEDVRADVRVEAAQLDRGRVDRPHDRALGLVVHGREAELGIDHPGLAIGVGVRLHARIQSQRDRGALAEFAADRDDPLQFERVVHHDRIEPGDDRLAQLLRRLVVAVEDDPFGREAAPQRQPQLAARADIEPGALLLEDRQDRRAEIGLPGVDDAPLRVVLREGRTVLAAPRPNRRLVVYIERRPILPGERDEIDPIERQVARRVNAGGDRPEHFPPPFPAAILPMPQPAASRTSPPTRQRCRRLYRAGPLPARHPRAASRTLVRTLFPRPWQGRDEVRRPPISFKRTLL